MDLSTTMLSGDGRNRWFDKSVQLITCANGKAALNFEHAWGDGVAVLRFFNEIWEDAINTPLPDAAAPAAPPRQLEWNVDTAVRATAEDAGAKMDAWLQRLAVNIEEVTDVDKTFPKRHGVSPDGFMQMAIQLAHYKCAPAVPAPSHALTRRPPRLHGHSVSTYESASTAAFKHGRTETIRSATMDSAAMCRAFQDPNASRADKEAALRKAVQTHSATTKECAMGKGVDRHLFALRRFADKVPPPGRALGVSGVFALTHAPHGRRRPSTASSATSSPTRPTPATTRSSSPPPPSPARPSTAAASAQSTMTASESGTAFATRALDSSSARTARTAPRWRRHWARPSVTLPKSSAPGRGRTRLPPRPAAPSAPAQSTLSTCAPLAPLSMVGC